MERPYKHSTIKELSESERPREKLLLKGPEALTVPELLAIIIGGGTTDKTAVELMQEIMRDCEDKLMTLSKMTIEELMQYKGIGEAKAISIMAAAEIGRRRLEEKANSLKQITDGKVAYEYMYPRIQNLNHEECWALLLNNDARLIKCVHLSQGGITETAVDPRIIMRHAILANATCFILVHNHPSGNLRPSTADKDLTKKVKLVGQTMNIRLIDHVIVADGDYYSFAENGIL
ncbi:MAG: DNA repair protein RadC [Bacteroidaceae bacterium]|nr:DNA repair protein RadC [Bacteroidaceae bacterium]